MAAEPRAADRLFVALDVEALAEADALLAALGGVVTGCKVGAQLFTAAGPAAVERARRAGYRVFLDLKFHDIPNTVAGAVREATRLEVAMLTVHAAGGAAMMRAAAEAAARAAADFGVPRPLCLGVTVLTSLDRRALDQETGVPGTVEAQVIRLATRAREAGLDGAVASPQEIGLIRRTQGAGWVVVAPGIRPAGAAADDQARTATPAAAIRAGARYLVVGRPITTAPDPARAARAIVDEIAKES